MLFYKKFSSWYVKLNEIGGNWHFQLEDEEGNFFCSDMILGKGDEPDFIDKLFVVDYYFSKKAREYFGGNTCINHLIYKFKIEPDKCNIAERCINLYYAKAIALLMAALVDYVFPREFKEVDVITYVPDYYQTQKFDVFTKSFVKDPIKVIVADVKRASYILSSKSKRLIDLFLKVKDIPEFKKLGKERRYLLASQAYIFNYQLYPYKPVYNKTILIIDDITTTGATLSTLAKISKEMGAKKVIALVAGQTI